VLRRWAQRSALVVALAGLLSVGLIAQTTTPAQALVPAPLPVSLVGSGAAVACTASVVCGTAVVAATVACLVYCDDVLEWAQDRIIGSGWGSGGEGAVFGSTWTIQQGATPDAPVTGTSELVYRADINPAPTGGGWTKVRHAPTTATGDYAWCCYAHDVDVVVQSVCKAPGGAVTSNPGTVAGSFASSRNGAPVFRDYWVPSGCPQNSWPLELNIRAGAGSGLCTNPSGGGWACGGSVRWVDESVADAAITRGGTGPQAGQAAQFRAVTYCRTPGGATASGASATYSSAAAIVPADCSDILAGSYRERLVVQHNTGTSGSPVWETFSESGVDLTDYPACQDGECELGWEYVDPQTQACKWGPYTMPGSDCAGLPPAQEPTPTVTGTSSTTHTNPDGSVVVTETQTLSNGKVRTITTTTYPDGSKDVRTVVQTSPGGAVESDTTVSYPAPGANPNTPEDPDAADCFPNGWGIFNPAEWVLKPVKCALVWAFVPSAATMTAVQTFGSDLINKAPFGYITQGIDYVGTAVPEESCATPLVVALDLPSVGTVTLLDSENPNGVWSVFFGYRDVLAVLLYIGVFGGLGLWAFRKFMPATTSAA
jgi:hypothetical protein